MGSGGKEVLKEGTSTLLGESRVHCFNSGDGFHRCRVVSQQMCAVYCVLIIP